MSCSMLIDLVNKKISAFRYPYSIVVLDGDIRLNRANLKKIKNTDNVLVLPGNSSPERLIAKSLYNLSDANPLWETVAKGYSKQVCFRNYSFEQINAMGEDGRQNAKKWFNEQLDHCGGNGNKILNPFCASIRQDCENFKLDFNKMIRKYIHD